MNDSFTSLPNRSVGNIAGEQSIADITVGNVSMASVTAGSSTNLANAGNNLFLNGFEDYNYDYGVLEEFPKLREANYSSSIRYRLEFQKKVSANPIGPPDLIHWGRYVGTTSSQFNSDDFNATTEINPNEDGYIGFYHYVNGIDHQSPFPIDKYVFDVMGIYKKEDNFYWSQNNNSPFDEIGKKELIVTFCSYNIFNKSDFRLKYVVTPISTSKRTLLIDKSYQIIPNDNLAASKKKIVSSLNFNKIPSSFWTELQVSLIIRLFVQLDDPAKQLPGLVSFPQPVLLHQDLLHSIDLLVSYLPKGHITYSDPCYGSITGCGGTLETNASINKTNVYRNRLIDTLIRLCQLEVTGGAIDHAINKVTQLSNNTNNKDEWTYVVLLLLKLPNGGNTSVTFVNMIHSYLSNNKIYSTQACLILLEQVKFLISKADYVNALKIAETCIKVLPLDFECWFYLAVCYTLVDDYDLALLAINSLPISLNEYYQSDLISGIEDPFADTFIDNFTNNQEPISEKTFLSYFPPMRSYVNKSLNQDSQNDTGVEGRIKGLWDDIYIFNANNRHPITGNRFYKSPLICKSAKQSSLVDQNLVKLCGPDSIKLGLSSISSNSSTCSILDFNKKSTWGRCYDLLSFIIARIGWDSLLLIKHVLFRSNGADSLLVNDYVVSHNDPQSQSTKNYTKLITCELWLEQMFMVIVQDLRALSSINSPGREQNHSVLEWEVLGLLGWSVKYNLKSSISSLITSVLGNNQPYEFNYFGSMQLLMIYDEFVLSEVDNCSLDMFNDSYDKGLLTNKLILKQNPKLFNSFTKNLTQDSLPLDYILLIVMKLVSWNVRWYQYLPNYLIHKILMKLCIVHSSEFIVSKLKIVFEQNKKSISTASTKFSLFRFMGSPSKNKSPSNSNNLKHFDPEDSIVTYLEHIIKWIEEIKSN